MWSSNQPNLPYKITYKGDEADNGQHYSPEIEDLIAETHAATQRAKPKTLVRLQRLIKKYPKIPIFRNYLTSYYHLTNQRDLAYATNRKLLKDFPDYLFGTINLAAEYIEKEEYDKVPEVLGEELDLHQLCPHRKVFHIGEFESFMYVATHYLLETRQIEKAIEKIYLLETVFPESPQLGYLLEMMDELTAGGRDLIRYTSRARGYDESIQTDEPPQLNHPELQVLYEHDLTIPKEKLEALLQLPRETLIADLKAILWDSVCRLEHFSDWANEEPDWPTDRLTFPLHALFLLTELKANESLSVILDCFRQGEDYLNFWFDDHLFETLPHFIYHLGSDQLDTLKSFILEPKICHYGKGIIVSGVPVICRRQPSRAAEIVEWYESILKAFLQQKENEHLVEKEVVTTVAMEIGELPDTNRFLPLVRQFYDYDLIDYSMIGTYEDFVEELAERQEEKAYEMPIYESILDLYDEITSSWYGYLSEEGKRDYDQDFAEKMDRIEKMELEKKTPTNLAPPKPAQSTKVGRNDPCPCGSGKKYKKCCWGKDQ